MRFVAKAKYVSYSPYKLRPIVDVIRGKNVVYALNWLAIHKTKRSIPVEKILASAVANAKDLKNAHINDLVIEKICVDQGPIRRYHKPGAMGRAMIQRKRLCHLEVVLQLKTNKKEI